MIFQVNFFRNKELYEKKLETEFLMEIRKAVLDNKLLGYYFFFSKLNLPENKNFMSYSIESHKNNSNKNDEINKIIKYKAIIKPSPKLSIILNESNKKNKINNTSINNCHTINNNNIIKNSEETSSYISKKDKLESSLLDISDENNKSSNISEIFQKNNKPSKFPSVVGLNENEEIVDDNFIPKCPINFSFDLENKCYNFEKDNNNSKLLKNKLQREAMAKIREYKEYLKALKKRKNSIEFNRSRE